MEKREIIVANTKTQKRTKIESAATTLGELKADMRSAGIEYDGMTFTEGISKTQLVEDNSQLPTNVMYKGERTNNLVILLTNTEKKIASGADRSELYNQIKSQGLQEEIRNRFGKNYTNVSTSDLENYLNNRGHATSSKPVSKAAPKKSTSKPTAHCPMFDSFAETIKSLIDIKFISVPELETFINQLQDILKEASPTPVKMTICTTGTLDVTGDDIDDMIASMQH